MISKCDNIIICGNNYDIALDSYRTISNVSQLSNQSISVYARITIVIVSQSSNRIVSTYTHRTIAIVSHTSNTDSPSNKSISYMDTEQKPQGGLENALQWCSVIF